MKLNEKKVHLVVKSLLLTINEALSLHPEMRGLKTIEQPTFTLETHLFPESLNPLGQERQVDGSPLQLLH
jgi:hypothetical protein